MTMPRTEGAERVDAIPNAGEGRAPTPPQAPPATGAAIAAELAAVAADPRRPSERC